EAEFVRTLLEAQGIAATVHGANASTWLSPLMGPAVAPGVYVREADVSSATDLIQRYQQHDLPAGQPWTCRRCGEAIEGQFTQCWNCGATRDWNIEDDDRDDSAVEDDEVSDDPPQ